jgi:hypothetical protein
MSPGIGRAASGRRRETGLAVYRLSRTGDRGMSETGGDRETALLVLVAILFAFAVVFAR